MRASCNFAPMTVLVVAADDRTGALETAGACADAGLGPVLVEVDGGAASIGAQGQRVVVVDLATRHVDPALAARRAVAVDRFASECRAHKIDSTLRGNWAHELVARLGAGEGRVLVVPAFPGAGRTCIDGAVHEFGVPIGAGAAGTDARASVRSSRPADHLHAAGAGRVDQVASADEVTEWLVHGRAPFAVCDAADDGDLDALGAAWASVDRTVLFAGTSASISAAAAHLDAGHAPTAQWPRPSHLPAPILVVCGSLHPTARAQIDALGTRCGPNLVVLASPLPTTTHVTHEEAAAAADALAARARQVIDDGHPGTLVLLGGDTAAAVLGDAPILVGGTIAPGMPWGRAADGRGPLVVTRAGGFGTSSSLVELLVEGTRG